MNVQQTKYLNRGQQYAMLIQANIEVIIASRRFGKSFGIVAPRVIRNVVAMPGSTGAFVAATFKQAKMRTLPAMLLGLKELGILPGVHYVIGRKPPKRLCFAEPIVKPEKYDDVLSFWNGTIMVVISQDVKMSANSMTIDWVICDEARGLDYEALKNEVFPANGGTTRYFGQCPWHHSMLFVTDMPASKEGSWLLNYREKATEQINDTIAQLVAQRYQITHDSNMTDWSNRQVKEIDQLLIFFRKRAVLYKEYSIFENIDLVGVDYVKQLKRDLPPLIFQTSILCRRITTIMDGFYPNFKLSIHTYSANDNNKLKKLGWKDSYSDDGCMYDSDLNKNAPIAIAFDYNANINWLVAGQVKGTTLRVIKSFYVKYERKLRELVDDFCNYYRYHNCKKVVIYYDSTALGSNYAVNKMDFITVIIQQFNINKWGVNKKYLGAPMRHSEKHILINDCLKAVRGVMPIINKENNEALITSIQAADVAITSRGFHKDKGGEKLKETEDDPLELRTDGSDAFDTLVIGTTTQPYTSTVYMGSAT